MRPRSGRDTFCVRILATSAGLRVYPSAPFAADVGENAGNLIVAQHRTDRRHQPGGTFLATQQDPRRNPRLGKRERRPDEARCETFLTASVGLMTRLTDVAVDLAAGVEPPLFLRCQRGDRRGHAWLAGPFNPSQDVGGARAEIAARSGNR